MRDPDRHLIDAAIAAGRLRRIPAGVTVASPDWGRYATTDPLTTLMGKRAYAVLHSSPGRAFTVRDVLKEMGQRGFASTGPTNLDRHARVRASLDALTSHGIVEVVPPAKATPNTLRWRLKDGSAKPETRAALQAESRRLRGGKPQEENDQ